MENLETLPNQILTKISYTQQMIVTNITSRLPVTPNRVNEYLFSLQEYDVNTILVQTMKSRTDK